MQYSLDELEKEIMETGKPFKRDFKGEFDFYRFYVHTFPRVLKEIKLETMKNLECSENS